MRARARVCVCFGAISGPSFCFPLKFSNHSTDEEGAGCFTLTLKAPITTAADDTFCDIFSCFQKNKV